MSIDSKYVRKVSIKYNPKTDSNSSLISNSKRFVQSEYSIGSQTIHDIDCDYNVYLQQYQGLFIAQCQSMCAELANMESNLELMMNEQKNFA